MDHEQTAPPGKHGAGPPSPGNTGSVRDRSRVGSGAVMWRDQERPRWTGRTRLTLAALPAGAVTFGLFLAMDALIATDLPQVEPVRQIELVEITPADELEQPRRAKRQRPQRIDAAMQPPPPPALTARKSDIDLPGTVISGSAPDLPRFERLGDLVPPVPAITSRDAKPIRAPVPSYPDSLARRGIEGDCEVSLSINRKGEPFDIAADCSHPGFANAAERAVADVQFAPQIVRGAAVERHGVVYPIVFRLQE